jgi:penicillin-binding protein 2
MRIVRDGKRVPKFLITAIICLLSSFPVLAVTTAKKNIHHPVRGRAAAASTSVAAGAKRKAVTPSRTPLIAGSARKKTTAASRRQIAKRRGYDPWKAPNFASPADGDDLSGEDPIVRQAAVDALGNFNGSVVVVDPSNGRVLSIVNQKLAFQGGFTPCSTIKLMTSLAALSEGLVDRTTQIAVARRLRLDMTDALARSDNAYFAILGQKMGFDKVTYYARMYGLGEKAGLNIPEETPGSIVDSPEKGDGVGMMCSFGHGFKMTPLNLAALVGAIANNGTLHYLQYPRTPEAIRDFKPMVKRQLPIYDSIQEMLPGMNGAVEFGTARRASYDQMDSPHGMLYGKTGTCTDTSSPTHMGWFGSFNQIGDQKLVAVVMLTGGRAVSGPVASGVAGAFYRNLGKNSYFRPQQIRTASASASADNSAAVAADPVAAALTGNGPQN